MKASTLTPCALVLAPMFAAGCAVGPHPARPGIEVPVAWKEEQPVQAREPKRELAFAWWRIFEDPELNALEVQVVAANQDLRRAAGRVAEARALARVSAAERAPALSAGSSAARRRASANEANRPAGLDRETTDYRNGIELSYEIDFWGHNREGANAAHAEAFATEHELSVVMLTLTADTAKHYHEIRTLDAEMRVVEATLALRRDALNLQTTRHQAGLINETDVSRARTELATVEGECHAIRRRRARLEHALAVLCGEAPATFSIAVRTQTVALPAVPAGLPSELLQRRPDIAVSEQQLEAARARIAVAKADFFPRLSLTSSIGLASADLGRLTRGDSSTWSFGPSLYLPLFDGGRNRANLGAAEARYEQSAAAYRGVVLNAFREIEDALADLQALSLQTEAVRRALGASRDTASLAEERYQRGLSNYLDVVDARRVVFDAERSIVQLSGEQAVATINLAKAVGGGWQNTFERGL